MLTCPNPTCKKRLAQPSRQCPHCRSDLELLVQYVDDLSSGLCRAEEATRAGQLGEAVWAYLEVLEVDPDNATARRQVGQVVTAVRQFDEAAPSRRWWARLRRQARFRQKLYFWEEPEGDGRSWLGAVGAFLLAMVLFLWLGYWWGFHDGQNTPPAAETTPKDKDKEPKLKPFRPGEQPLGK
jgi:hypothetical protein